MKTENKQDQLYVIAAANGFMVRPTDNLREGSLVMLQGYHVFETFDAMVKHLREVLPQPEKSRTK